MPKPIFQDNGSGMHMHQSLWKGGEPLFYDETGYAGLSDMARWYIGGLLHHAAAILAFADPTTNSYKRLVPGYEAPVNLVYCQRNRSASCRIPLALEEPQGQARRVPLPRLRRPTRTWPSRRCCWPASTASRTGSSRPTPVDKDLYDLPPEELAMVPAGARLARRGARPRWRPTSDFLKAGGVFTDDLIETWVDYKRANEIDAIRLRPHPYEFALYYDI